MIIGIDEVGRGPWAGPVAAAAVILGGNKLKLKDSKQLSSAQRNDLCRAIRSDALFVGIGWVSPRELDEIGLSAAVSTAMRRAVANAPAWESMIIDGNVNYLADLGSTATIKADATVPSVSAASIIAKVARDRYMQLVSQIYPEYGFDQHVGYGTALHQEALAKHGPTPIHRRSFRSVLQMPML